MVGRAAAALAGRVAAMTHEKLGYITDTEMLAADWQQASPGKEKLKATSCEVAGTWRGGRSVEKVLSAINTQQPSEWINGGADREYCCLSSRPLDKCPYIVYFTYARFQGLLQPAEYRKPQGRSIGRWSGSRWGLVFLCAKERASIGRVSVKVRSRHSNGDVRKRRAGPYTDATRWKRLT